MCVFFFCDLSELSAWKLVRALSLVRIDKTVRSANDRRGRLADRLRRGLGSTITPKIWDGESGPRNPEEALRLVKKKKNIFNSEAGKYFNPMHFAIFRWTGMSYYTRRRRMSG